MDDALCLIFHHKMPMLSQAASFAFFDRNADLPVCPCDMGSVSCEISIFWQVLNIRPYR